MERRWIACTLIGVAMCCTRCRHKENRPASDDDLKASDQLKPDGQVSCGRWVAKIQGRVCEEFFPGIFNDAIIPLYAAELLDVFHGHGFAFQQECLSDGFSHGRTSIQKFFRRHCWVWRCWNVSCSIRNTRCSCSMRRLLRQSDFQSERRPWLCENRYHRVHRWILRFRGES